MNLLTLKGIDILKIRKTPLVREFQSETEGFKGFKYNIYAFRDKAFIAHENDQFNVDFANGQVYSLELDDTDEGLSLLNYQTVTGVINVAKTEALVAYYSSKNFKPISADLMPAELANA